jgi:hypothetical protein
VSLYAECNYAQCHYAECYYAECHNAEFRGAYFTNFSLNIDENFTKTILKNRSKEKHQNLKIRFKIKISNF